MLYSNFFNRKTVTILSLILLGLNACIPHKEILYFQDHSTDKNYQSPFGKIETVTEKYILRANDNLTVFVNSPDKEISQYFNAIGGEMTTSSQQTSEAGISIYVIDDSMNIQLPYVGTINLANCTLQRAKQKIVNALSPYLKEAHVIVKMANTAFTILGETKSPGRISLPKEQITIFEAIALSGDLTIYGKRRDIKLLRKTDTGTQTFHVDLTDKNIVDSDFYYIYPNDLIYVRPMKAKSWGFGETISFGLITAVMAIYISMNALVK